MSITDSLSAAAAAVNNLATQIASERAALIASVPAEAQPTDILAGSAHNLFVSPADFVAALSSNALYGSAFAAGLAAALGRTVFVQPFRNVYVDSVNGNDANSGLSLAEAVRTVEHAVTLFGAGQYLNLYFVHDTTITGFFLGACPAISFASATPGTPVTVTLSAAAPVSSGNGDYAVISLTARTQIYFHNDVNLTMGPLPATLNGRNVFGILWGAGGSFSTTGITFTRAAGAAAPLFGTYSRLEVAIAACTFTGAWPGGIFANVAAGVNPNTLWNYTTNLTAG